MMRMVYVYECNLAHSSNIRTWVMQVQKIYGDDHKQIIHKKYMYTKFTM